MKRGTGEQATSALAPGPEFDLIRRMLRTARSGVDVSPADDLVVGPGDDCAIFSDGWAVSCDVSVEDVHFRRQWLSPEDIGYRAAAAALSDLAAVAARPVALLVAYALPLEDLRGAAAELLQAGVAEAAARVGGVIAGGDLSRSPGAWMVAVTVLGQAERPVLRRGAEPGDELWVTGTLGGAAAAVEALEAGEAPKPADLAAFCRPLPRVAEARWLAENDLPRAMIDLSDGLGGDAGHLAAASGVGIVLEAEALPTGGRPLRQALSGGDDLELCFAARPGAVEPVRAVFEERFGLELTRVGGVSVGSGVMLQQGELSPRPLEEGGFDHLDRPGAP